MNLASLFRPGDVLVIAMAVWLVGGLFAHAWMQPAGTALIVHARGGLAVRAPLDRDGNYEVAGRLGATRIEVRQGRARVAADPGPRQICVRQGWISRAGEASLCLANEVSLEIGGAVRAFDSVSY